MTADPSAMPRRVLAGLALVVGVTVIGVLVVTRPAIPPPVDDLLAPIAAATPTAQPTPRVTPVPVPGHEVYGYVPYREMVDGIADHVAGTRLTTVGLFSVTHTPSGALDESLAGYHRITGRVGRDLARAAQDAGARVELVYTSFGEAKNRRFFADESAQATAIDGLVDLTADLELDGINVDVESLAVTDIPAYGAFVGRLREALRERVKTGQVSVATASGP